MNPNGPGDLRPTPPESPANPLDVPSTLMPIKVEIDWLRRVVRMKQVPSPLLFTEEIVYIPLYALKEIAAEVARAEATGERAALTQRGRPLT